MAERWSITRCARCGSSVSELDGITVCGSGPAWCEANPRPGRTQVASGTVDAIEGEYRSEGITLGKALALLDVRPLPGSQGAALMVDATNAMTSPFDVQLWVLRLGDDGVWRDDASDAEGTLGACLGAIVCCYLAGVAS